MIRLRLPDVLTSILAASLAACGGSTGAMPKHDGGIDATPPDGASDALPDASPDWQPNLAASCPETRWVGFLKGGSCDHAVPAGMGWSSTRAFPPGAMNDRGPELARFCVFETDSPRGQPPVDKGMVDGMTLAADCKVTAPLAPPPPPYANFADHPMVWQKLRQTLIANLVPPAAPVTGSPIRIAVVDSSPDDTAPSTGQAGLGPSPHGPTLGRIIRELTCPPDMDGPTCVGRIANHRAFTLTSGGLPVPPRQGGFYGSQLDLAQAINRAVAAWQMEAGGTPLVINLSVGWEPFRGYEGTFKPDSAPADAGRDMRGPVQALFAAIAHARCLGALVIAAAGNRTAATDGISTTGATYPGVWETTRALPDPECATRYGGMPPLAGGGPYRPLVYAVGGLDGNDDPTFLTRTRGRPRLAAYSENATASKDPTLDQRAAGVLTGTSVAAAVTSAAAALVWSQDPTRTGTQVMDILYDTGPTVSGNPDLCLTGMSCKQVHRLDLCAAVATAKACPPGPAPCQPVRCTSATPPRGVPSWSSTDWSTVTLDVTHMSPIYAPTIAVAPVVSPDLLFPTNAGQPYVGPQPGGDGCNGVCGIGGSGRPAAIAGGRRTPALSFRRDTGSPTDPLTSRTPRSRPVAATSYALYFSVEPEFLTSAYPLTGAITIEETNIVEIFDISTDLRLATPANPSLVIDGMVLQQDPVRARVSLKHEDGTGAKSTMIQLLPVPPLP
jgi:subtilisin family serine protease